MDFLRLRNAAAALILSVSTAAAQVVISPVTPVAPVVPIVPVAPFVPGVAANPLAAPAISVQPALAAPQLRSVPTRVLPSRPVSSLAEAAGRASVDAGAGVALLQELHGRTGLNYRTRTYGEAGTFIFSQADNVERNGVRGVEDAYSGVFVPGTSGNGSDYSEQGDQNDDGFSDRQGMNIEHTWPQSFFSKQLPMKSDVHHLMATFIHPNGIRSNLPFGEVKGPGEYHNSGGAKVGQGVFEPPDAAKGRVARAVLYFYTRYYDRNIYNGAYGEAFWNKNIEMLLRWNRQFPPTQDEMRRNDLVEQFQGNRNPFIDEPSLADRIGVAGFKRTSRYEALSRQIAERYQGIRLP